MWIRLGCIVAIAVSATACGGGAKGGLPDAGAGADAGDCPVHGGCGALTTSTDEGGSFMVERWQNYIETGAGTVLVTFNQATAFVTTPQPAAPYTDLGSCYEIANPDSKYWPTKVEPDRTYLDFGSATFESGDVSIELLNRTTGVDSLGRSHDLWANRLLSEDIAANRVFDVVISGGPELPARTWEDAIYVPGLPEVTPKSGEFPPLDSEQDLDLTFATRDSSNLPEGTEIIDFAIFYANNNDPVIFCPTLHEPSSPDEAFTLTIPAEFILRAKELGAVVVQRGQIFHGLRWVNEETEDGGRLDMLGLNCHGDNVYFDVE